MKKTIQSTIILVFLSAISCTVNAQANSKTTNPSSSVTHTPPPVPAPKTATPIQMPGKGILSTQDTGTVKKQPPPQTQN